MNTRNSVNLVRTERVNVTTMKTASPLLSLTMIATFTGTCLAGGGGWVNYLDETASRLSSDPALGVNDLQEKDYAVGDVDGDGVRDGGGGEGDCDGYPHRL